MICRPRVATDAIRTALSYNLGQLPAVRYEDRALRIIRAEAACDDKGCLRVYLNLQFRGKEVGYPHIGVLSYDGSSLTWEENPLLPVEIKKILPLGLWDIVLCPQRLLEEGQSSLYTQDLRAIGNKIVLDNLLKFRTNSYIATKSEDVAKAETLKQTLELATLGGPGTATLTKLVLEADSNKVEIAKEFTLQLKSDLESLADRWDKCEEEGTLEKNRKSLEETLKAIDSEGIKACQVLGVDLGDVYYDLLQAIQDAIFPTADSVA